MSTRKNLVSWFVGVFVLLLLLALLFVLGLLRTGAEEGLRAGWDERWGEVIGRDVADAFEGGGADGVGDAGRSEAVTVEVAVVAAVDCVTDGGCGLRALTRSSSIP